MSDAPKGNNDYRRAALGGTVVLIVIAFAWPYLRSAPHRLSQWVVGDVKPPKATIKLDPSRRRTLRLKPLEMHASADVVFSNVKIVHKIKNWQACVPGSLRYGGPWPTYPVEQTVEVVQRPGGVGEFVTTYDYLECEDYWGKGDCRYGIDFASFSVSTHGDTYGVHLRYSDFDTLDGGREMSMPLFCIAGRDMLSAQPQGQCRTQLVNTPAAQMPKYKASFMIESEELR